MAYRLKVKKTFALVKQFFVFFITSEVEKVWHGDLQTCLPLQASQLRASPLSSALLEYMTGGFARAPSPALCSAAPTHIIAVWSRSGENVGGMVKQ